MFGTKKNKEVDFTLVIAERESFLSVLMTLLQLLKDSGNNAQFEFVHELIELLNQNSLNLFVKSINGVEMWGGAGAVWEVYIENDEAKAFEKGILRLICLMEKAKIRGKGILPIKKIFENNLEK